MKESVVARVELRKKPAQARSIKKYNRILDEVAELVDAGGTDGITTNLIAESVGVPVGTLYQFFPNKESILFALFERQLQELDTYFEPFLEDSYDQMSIDELIDIGVLSMSTAYQKVPGMVNIMNSMHVHPDFRELIATNNCQLAHWLAGILVRRYPDASLEQVELVAEAIIELGDSVFRKLLLNRPKESLRTMILTGFKMAIVGLITDKLTG